VNVVSTELASTPLIVSTRSFSGGLASLVGGAGNELSLFLSLVTGFLETIPVPTPGMLEPESSTLSKTAGAALTTKARSKDLARNLEPDTKNPKREESPALPPSVPALQEVLAFRAKPPAALDLPASMPVLPGGSDQAPKNDNSNDGGSVRRIDMAPNLLAPASTVPAVALGELAFALRLTPNRSEILNARQAVNPAAPLIGTNSASGLNPQPAQTSTAGLEKSISNQAQDLSAAPTASYATVARGEQTSEPRPVSSPASIPKITGNATAWPWLRTPQASTENLALAPRSDPGLNSGPELESEPQLTSEPQSNAEPRAKSEPQLEADSSEVAANGSEYDPERAYRLEGAQTHSATPDIHSSSHPTNPAGGSQESQPEPTEYKTGLAVKQEFPGFRLTGSRLEGSANVPAASAWPSDAAGAPDMPANSEPAGDGPATIVPSEPEIKAEVAPAITRQISLNLSTDDST